MVKGVLISVVLWSFYLLPGNSLDLNIQDLMDPFIMRSARDDNIALTISVFAARYIVPAAVLIWGVIRKNPDSPRVQIFTVAITPILFGIGFSFAKQIMDPAMGIPWEMLCSLTVLYIYAIVLIIAFLLCSLFKN